ncbi:glycoside hydrolase family 128 protein [Whalleya microplaca]|nr:glycoside hydrolase family 128 protein [Whalleya microplaca]
MRRSCVLLAAIPSVVFAQTRSAKRGLVFIPSADTPQDNQIWVRSGSDLTWYYNYVETPSPAFSDVSQEQFEFVPMLWGARNDTSFLDSVESLIKSGRNISYVLSFNEPDSAYGGGSNIEPSVAADVWVKNIAPLAEKGVKLGLPACTAGEGGIPWLQQFLGHCSDLISTGNEKKNCTYDFVSIHWYGNFEGLASHLGSYSAAFPNVSQWITEYNYDNQDLSTTEAFYNTSSEYFDRMDSVARYSFFGSFRSDQSNVGANAVMLSKDGKLTDIGSWYLGGTATGVDPQSAAGRNQAPVAYTIAVALAGCAALLFVW